MRNIFGLVSLTCCVIYNVIYSVLLSFTIEVTCKLLVFLSWMHFKSDLSGQVSV